MINGKANVNVNVRSGAIIADNIINAIPAGKQFTGSGFVTDTTGTKWIVIETIDNKPAFGYVSTKANITYTETPDTPTDTQKEYPPYGIWEFVDSKGITRRIKYSNPVEL